MTPSRADLVTRTALIRLGRRMWRGTIVLHEGAPEIALGRGRAHRRRAHPRYQGVRGAATGLVGAGRGVHARLVGV